MRHPDVSADALLELLSILQDSAELVERASTTVKVDYLVSRHQYRTWSYAEMRRVYDQMYFEPPFRSWVEAWLHAEPEFSRRLVSHMSLNHWQHIDSPRREPPALLEDDLFDTRLTGIEPDGTLDAAELLPLLKDSKLLRAAERDLLSGNLELIDRHNARYACLQVALASQAYHRRHGEFPESLADLQPEYLAELPDDLYSPQPAAVIYRRTGHDAVVYSQYTNGEDDGGEIVTYEEARGADLPDLGLRIRAPNLTRPVAVPDR
jgi:hypothetical protein